MLSAIKSLLSFAYKLGITPVNAGAALKSPSPKNALAERILPELEVQQLLAEATNSRDHLLPSRQKNAYSPPHPKAIASKRTSLFPTGSENYGAYTVYLLTELRSYSL
jgi:integrase/recombinase XerD